jgi:hypothetical protein
MELTINLKNFIDNIKANESGIYSQTFDIHAQSIHSKQFLIKP